MKRLSSVFLIALMLITSQFSANSSIQAEDNVTFTKTASAVAGMVNTWDIELGIKSKRSETPQNADIVLVLDISASMNGTKMTSMINAAKAFVENVLTKSPTSRIGIITFSSSVAQPSTFSSNKEQLKNIIDGLRIQEYTFLQAGIRSGSLYLNGSSNPNKYLVVMTDGDPNITYRTKTNLSTASYVVNENGRQVWSKDIPESYFDYSNSRQGAANEYYISNSENTGISHYNAMYSAISESRYAKARNQFIYTVGLETSNLANVMMTEIATNGNFYKSTASNLSDIYNNIADSITAQLKEVVVTDQMGLGFTIYDEDLSKIVTAEGNASFSAANQTLTWNIGDKLKPHPTDAGYDYAKLTYRIQVTDEILELGLPLEGLFESNRETKMSYKDLDGSTRSKTVDSPKVDPTFLKVSKELRDHKGNVVVDPNYDFDITVSSDNYSKVFNLKAGESITSTSLRHFGQYSFSEVDDRYTVTSEVSNMLIGNERLDVSIKVINQEKSGPDIVSDKTVDDDNGNGYAERGETLHYSIYVDNDSDAPARLLEVKDSLDLLLPYIVDPRSNVVDLLNDGVSTTTTVGQLMDGLSIYVAAKGSVRLDFSLTLLDNLDVDLVTKLKNIAIVGETTPEVTIDTTRPKFIASKSVMDANTNSIAEPNETLTYTIRVENNGLIDTGELVIQDTLDDLLPSILDPSANVLTFLLEGDIFTDNVATLMAGDISYNLEPGQVLTLSFDVTLKAEVTDTELTNIASVGPLKPDAKIPVGKPKVSAEKLVSDHNQDGVAEPGEILYYTLKIQNTGNVAALGVTIQDDLADIIDYIVSPNLINAKVKIGMEEKSISLDDLREGIVRNIMPFTEIEITFQVGLIQDLDVNTVTVLKNRLIVDDIPYEAEIPTGAPKLVISKTVMDANDNGFAELGENLVYTIEVENTGNHIAKDIFIQDNFLIMIDYIDPPIDELSNDIDGRTLNELMEGFLIDIEAGAKIILTFQVTVKSDLDMEKVKMISNLATVFTETPEVEIPTGKAIINASKEVIDENNNQFAEPGEKLTYTISVSNTGQVEVKDLLVQDKMEELFDYLDDAKASGVKVMVGVDESTKTITQLREGFLIDLDADQSATITFDFYLIVDLDVDEITILKNIALVGSDTPEVEIPTGDSKLASEKTVSDANENGFAEPGEVITYTIHIGNSGKVLAEGVIVKDDLADLVDYVQDTTHVIVYLDDGSLKEYTLEDLKNGIAVDISAGSEVYIYFDLIVKEDLDVDEVLVLKNTAIVGDHTPEVEIPTGDTKLTTDKTVSDANENGFAEPGEKLTYTIYLANSGKVDSEEIIVKDDLVDLLDHIQDTTHVTVFLDDGELREFTLEDLKQGIAVHVRAGSEVSIYFDLLVKDDLNLDEVLVLKNTALIGDHTPEVEIPTGGSKLEAVKTYKDASGDEILQAGEVVTYGISIVNTGKVMAEGVFIQDTLSDLLKVLEDPSMNEVLIDVDGQVTKRVLKDLMQGFEMDIGAGSRVSISFTVKFIDELLIKQAVNTAHIDELRPSVSIPVEPSLPPKEVSEKPSPKPEVKPVKVAPKPSLPRTGMAVDMNPYILIALGSLLGVIGLRKRRRS